MRRSWFPPGVARCRNFSLISRLDWLHRLGDIGVAPLGNWSTFPSLALFTAPACCAPRQASCPLFRQICACPEPLRRASRVKPKQWIRSRRQVTVGRRNPFFQYRGYPLFEVVEGRIPAARFSHNNR